MTPNDRASKAVAGGVEQVRAAELRVLLRAEPGNDQVASFAEDKVAVAVLHQKRSAGAKRPLAGGRLERLPEAFAGGEFDGPKLAALADAVHGAVLVDERRGADAVNRGHVVSSPLELGSRFVLGKLEEHRNFADSAGVQIVAELARRHDRHPVHRLERHGPVFLAGFRIETANRLRVPNQKLPATTC